jgi:hypothetical protein
MGEQDSLDIMGVIEQVMTEAADEGKAEYEQEPVPKKSVKPKTVTEPQNSTEANDESDPEDFGDMPNGKIRYQKLKDQLAKQDTALAEEREVRVALERKIAELKEIEETQHLTEDQKLAYSTNKRIQELEAELATVKAKEIESTNVSKEDAFWGKHPELTEDETVKNEVAEKMLQFLQERKGLMQDVFEDKLGLEDVYKLIGYDAPQKQTKTVQDPSRVFGTTDKAMASKITANDRKTDYDDAKDRLSKGYNHDAVEAMNTEITNRIFGLGG